MAVGSDDCAPGDAPGSAAPEAPPQPGLLRDLCATSVWRVLPLILLYTIGEKLDLFSLFGAACVTRNV